MKILGLTGGIGSGKSTVAKLFSQLGVPIIDADVIAREIVQPNQPALTEIQNTLGAQYLTHEGTLDRSKLKQAIFNDPSLKLKLEAILHPLIRESLLKQVASLNTPLAMVVIPLLAENIEQYRWLDKIIVVDLPEALQMQRCIERDGLDKSTVEKILATQASRAHRLKIADFILDNSQDLPHLEHAVLSLYKKVQ